MSQKELRDNYNFSPYMRPHRFACFLGFVMVGFREPVLFGGGVASLGATAREGLGERTEAASLSESWY